MSEPNPDKKAGGEQTAEVSTSRNHGKQDARNNEAAQSSQSSSSDKKPSRGAAIVVGCILLAVAGIVIAGYIMTRNERKKLKEVKVK